MDIARHPVESSTIATLGYSEASATLEIEFKRGAVYRFFTVPLAVYEGLQTASSKGRFFNGNIRDRYPFERVH